ncbi:NADH dehydrogenase (ubiquinone) B14.7 subunit [Tachypleus tridentatus]|uniref:NADH dehydrogenase (ubiquinone) B14.7 subunit n=1 Tax=Tachypleus tridentatus TaxID=6853 RepID=UPI003FD38BC5
MGYSYYDTPDGEDCFQKMWYITKYATLAALGISVYDISLVSHPQGYLQTLGRISYWVAPFATMGAVFSATTCVATNLRKKDDPLNYFLGGCAAGSIMGAKYKSVGVGLGMCATLGIAGWLKRFGNDNGFVWFPVREKQDTFLNYYKQDWSRNVVPDPGKDQ